VTKTHREEDSFAQILLQICDCRKRGTTATKVNAEREPSSSRRRNGTDRVGPSAWRQLLRVTCEESARVVRYYSPPADSLQARSLFTFFRGSFHFSSSNSKDAEYSLISAYFLSRMKNFPRFFTAWISLVEF